MDPDNSDLVCMQLFFFRAIQFSFFARGKILLHLLQNSSCLDHLIDLFVIFCLYLIAFQIEIVYLLYFVNVQNYGSVCNKEVTDNYHADRKTDKQVDSQSLSILFKFCCTEKNKQV